MSALAPAFRIRAPSAPLPSRRLPCPTSLRLSLSDHARAWPITPPRPVPFRSTPRLAAAPCAPDRLTARTRQSQQQVTP
jgi:hypothetical protein